MACSLSLGGVKLSHRQLHLRTRTTVPHAAAQASAPETKSLNSYFEKECNVVTSLQVQDAESAFGRAIGCCAKEDIESAGQVLLSTLVWCMFAYRLYTRRSSTPVIQLRDATRAQHQHSFWSWCLLQNGAQEVCVVPQSAAITAVDAHNHPLVGSIAKGRSEIAALALWLLAERNAPAAGPNLLVQSLPVRISSLKHS